MEKRLSLGLLMLLLTACAPTKHKTPQSSVENKLSIVYNIHVPDKNKDDWEVMRMNMDGSEKRTSPITLM